MPVLPDETVVGIRPSDHIDLPFTAVGLVLATPGVVRYLPRGAGGYAELRSPGGLVRLPAGVRRVYVSGTTAVVRGAVKPVRPVRVGSAAAPAAPRRDFWPLGFWPKGLWPRGFWPGG